jgi:hypothetical protein
MRKRGRIERGVRASLHFGSCPERHRRRIRWAYSACPCGLAAAQPHDRGRIAGEHECFDQMGEGEQPGSRRWKHEKAATRRAFTVKSTSSACWLARGRVPQPLSPCTQGLARIGRMMVSGLHVETIPLAVSEHTDEPVAHFVASPSLQLPRTSGVSLTSAPGGPTRLCACARPNALSSGDRPAAFQSFAIAPWRDRASKCQESRDGATS